MNGEHISRINKKKLRIKNTECLTAKSGTLKIKYCYPQNIIVQHSPVKEQSEKREVKRLRNGIVIDTLTTVEIEEAVRIGGSVIGFMKEYYTRKLQNITF